MSDQKKVEEQEIKLEKYETTAYNDMVIEVEGKEGRVYRYYMPFNAPLAECHMAGINALQKIKEIYDDIIAKQKKEAEEKGDAAPEGAEEGAE